MSGGGAGANQQNPLVNNVSDRSLQFVNSHLLRQQTWSRI